MGRVFNKFYTYIILVLLLGGFCFALDGEFKNSLSKVELVKTGDSSYNVNLYTQKAYGQAPRVIKKSDYSYYILLPETKNSRTGASYSASSDIKNVSSSQYSYAGQDINNGYTKINITTDKPVNFNLNVKNMSAKSATTTASTKSPVKSTQTTVATKTQEKKTPQVSAGSSQNQNVRIKDKIGTSSSSVEKIVQLRPQNQSQRQNSSSKNQIKSTVSSQKQPLKTVQTRQSQIAYSNQTRKQQQTTKPVVKTVQKTSNTTQTKQTQSKQQISQPKPKTIDTPKPAQSSKPVSKPDRVSYSKEVQKPSQPKVEQSKSQPKADVINDVITPPVNNKKQEPKQATYSKGDIFVPMANNADMQDDEMFQDSYDESKMQEGFFNKLKSKFAPSSNLIEDDYDSSGFGLGNIFAIAFIIIVCICIFKTLGKKQTSAKLKNKSELIRQKKKAKAQRKPVKTNDEHFVFEQNLQKYAQTNNIQTKPVSNSIGAQQSSQYTTQSGSSYTLQDAKILNAQAQIDSMTVDDVPKVKMSDEEISKKTMQNLGLNEEVLELYVPSDTDEENIQKKTVASTDDIKKVANSLTQPKQENQSVQKPVEQSVQSNIEVKQQPQVQTVEAKSVQQQAPQKPAVAQKPSVQEPKHYVKISEVAKVQTNTSLNSQINQEIEPSEIISKEEIKQQVRLEVEKEMRKGRQAQLENDYEIIQDPVILQEDKKIPEYPGLKVLSSVEIAPERGFMCVSYEGSINLIGYIFDDVYPLYNFKTSKLKSYDIRFRLSQRDTKGAFFIVKVDNTKLLIKVTRISMELEVVM